MTVQHLNRTGTVRQAAINAVLAGCRPEYFPVIDGFAAGAGKKSGLLQSTTGQGEIIIVNGPIRDRLGFNRRDNIFGPGDRPKATIGRALRLIIMNALEIRPHKFDQSNIVVASQRMRKTAPWEPLHVERGSHAIPAR
jgi:hypothetical protein